jgi:hypothetical protein
VAKTRILWLMGSNSLTQGELDAYCWHSRLPLFAQDAKDGEPSVFRETLDSARPLLLLASFGAGGYGRGLGMMTDVCA